MRVVCIRKYPQSILLIKNTKDSIPLPTPVIQFKSLMNKGIRFTDMFDFSDGSRKESLFEVKKVQVGKDQEKAQSEKDSHSKN